jgi:hypothetical protein
MMKLQKFRLLLLVLVGLLCTPLVISTPANVFQIQAVNDSQNMTAEVSRNIHVAVLDEPVHSAPAYAGTSGGGINNNFTGMVNILEQGGYDVDVVNVHDISERRLITASYDVFVLVDNFPRDNITNLVWDFWKGGGGILALDGSALYLCYMGILPPEATGTTGQGVYWDYAADDIAFTVLHPISKSYEIPSMIPTDTGYLLWDWTMLSSSSIAGDLVRIATSTTSPTSCSVLGYDSADGGKVVTVAFDLYNEAIPELDQLFRDAMDWLAPRPKGHIAFDYAHHPRLGVDSFDPDTMIPGYYSEMRNLWVSQDYTFDKLYPTEEVNLTSNRLSMYDIIVLVSPDSNYTSSEVTALQEFVANGGSLLIMGDNAAQFAKANDQFNRILQPFDMYLNIEGYLPATTTYTHDHEEPILERTNGGLRAAASGYINFTGNDAIPLWTNGIDTIVALQQLGHGRVVVSADMNWASNNFIGDDDNTQFLINIANWLSATSAQILLYVDEPWSDNYYVTPVAQALNDLGARFYLTADPIYFNMSLKQQSWRLVVVDNPWDDVYECYSTILQYVQNGGRFLMSGYQVDHHPTDPLWAYLGFEFAYEQPEDSQVYIWQLSSPIFHIPNEYGANNFTATLDYGDEGDLLQVTTGSALAGYNMSRLVGNATIVLGPTGRTLYNGYLIDQFGDDNDESAYLDNFELWENEIAFMMRPLLTHPNDIVMSEGDDVAINWHWSTTGESSYILTVNGTVIDSGMTGEYEQGTILVGLSSLDAGIYFYELSITGRFGISDTDLVKVNVTALVTPTNTTVNPSLPTTLLIVIIAGVGIVIVTAIILLKKKHSP